MTDEKRPHKRRRPPYRRGPKRDASAQDAAQSPPPEKSVDQSPVKQNPEKKSLIRKFLDILSSKTVQESVPGTGSEKSAALSRKDRQRDNRNKNNPPRQKQQGKQGQSVKPEPVVEAAPEPEIPVNKEPRRIVISMEPLETRVAMLTGKRLDEYQIERSNHVQMAGAIYLGRVVNLEPSLEAAFVDIGAEKNAFLHYRDMLPMTHDLSERVNLNNDGKTGKKRDFNSKLAERLRKLEKAQAEVQSAPNEVIQREMKLHSGKLAVKDIPKLFPSGSEVLVQVSKAPIGTKGARVTTNISIPGRYLVLLPYSDHISISKKIDDRKERERLKNILSSFELPKGLGLICRTIGEGRRREHFENDLSILLEIWQRIENALLHPKPPVCLYREPSLLELTVRDSLTEDIDEIIVDCDEAHQILQNRIQSAVGESGMNLQVKRHRKHVPIFDEYGVSKQISQIFSRSAPLKSGGYLIIEETEALVSIDVNTGRAKGGKDLPETILATNLEAAEEIARQLRLRNVGGLIVIDFIDMIQDKHRRELYQAMKKFTSADRVKTDISFISKFGLMEMTRRREQESLLKTVYDNCPYCAGCGKIRSVFSMSVEIHRRVQDILKRGSCPIRVTMHPEVLARMKKEDVQVIDELEKRFGTTLSFRPDPELHLEEFKLVNPDTGKEFPSFNGSENK